MYVLLPAMFGPVMSMIEEEGRGERGEGTGMQWKIADRTSSFVILAFVHFPLALSPLPSPLSPIATSFGTNVPSGSMISSTG